MDTKKRRSVLRKSTTVDFVSTDATPRLKRRISFSGKHLVREFQSEEEPRTWDNSYEILDHLNVDETVSNKYVSKNISLRSALKRPHPDKENVVQVVSHDVSQTHRNVSVTNNSVLSTTKDLINISYRKYNIENSVDITLFESELKYRVGDADDRTTTYINSFSVDENEKELPSIGLVERTVDFIQNDSKSPINSDLIQENLNMREASMMVDCAKNDTIYSEYMDGIEKELTTIYMNDSLSTSLNEQPPTGTKKTIDKRKSIKRPVAMEFSPTNAKQFNKENIIPTLNANATINNSCYMEIDDHCLGPNSKVNVERESLEFQEKLDQLSILQQSDDNMQWDINQTTEVSRGGAIPKVKSRSTINFNQPIEVSPLKDESKATRQTFYCSDNIRDVSQVKAKTNSMSQTVNFLNEDINEESSVKAKTTSKKQTINFNADISKVSPALIKSNPSRQTVNFNEDIRVTPVKLSRESENGYHLNKPGGSIRKHGQPLVVRKICTTLLNKSKTDLELEQQRMLRFKRKLEENPFKEGSSEKSSPSTMKSLNISLSSLKNLSFSPDSSPPLIPSEFKVYNLKQLNDELERGNLHIYSNAPKTPSSDRKTKTPSQFSKNLQCSELSKSIKSIDYVGFYTTQDKKNNDKCRYSQADDMMLDNTSFLTTAKLGDETNNALDKYKESSNQYKSDIQIQKRTHVRHALNFDSENIDCELAREERNKNNNTMSKTEEQTVYLGYDIQIEQINDINSKDFKNVTFDNHEPTAECRTMSKAEQQTLYLDYDIENEQISNSNINPCHEPTVEYQTMSRSKQQTHYLDYNTENERVNDINPKHVEIVNIDGHEPTGESARQNVNFNIDVIDADSSLLNKEVFSTRFAGNYEPDNKADNRRQTSHNHQDMDLDKLNLCSTEVCKKGSISRSYFNNDQKTCNKLSHDRKSIHASQCMDLTFENKQTLENDANEEQIKRRTVLFHGEIQCEEYEDFRQKDSQLRSNVDHQTTLYNEQTIENLENELSLAENTNDHRDDEKKSSFEERKTLHFDNNNYISMDLSFQSAAMNKCDKQPLKASYKDLSCWLIKTKRKTHYYDRNEANIENELSLDENALTYEHKKETQTCETLHSNNNNDISTEQYETDCENDWPIDSEPKALTDKRDNLHSDGNNDIFIEESGAPVEYIKFSEATANPLNAAKLTLLRQSSANIKNSLAKKIKSFIQTTPVRMGSANRNHLNEMTPGTLEFIAEEKKSQIESSLDRVKFPSPLRSEVSTKRLHANLTPVVSKAKKRQTIVFDDCNMDETHTSRTPKSSTTKANIDINVIGINDTTHVLDDEQTMDISGIVSNETVILTTPPPTKQRGSRIPIPVSSGKKSTKSPSLPIIFPANAKEVTNATNYEEIVMKIDVGKDLENEEESFQMLRRATSSMQRKDLRVDPKSNGTELGVKRSPGKPSLFEDNPITISDVSVFFTAQRKSNDENSTVPLRDITAAMDVINISGLNEIERNKRKSFRNHYINITCDSPLEDIDQTRLSLVRTLSDDDDADEHDNVNKIVVEYNDTCHGQNSVTETVTEAATKSATGQCNVTCPIKRRSVKNFGNVSAVCRKCKRCQDTFLNETTSSTADSFVLPALPPFPDLDLDRLRRLRKRPTISDVNVLWQRVSLDRTIINPINISDDDCQILSDAEDDTSEKDESNLALKALRKYQKERQEFELKLATSLQEKKAALITKRPFVYRLENLLSNNPNNWIFDYQKQVRGIYIFSHRKMLTFSLSLIFAEVDPLGIDVKLKTVNLQQSHVPKKNWKAIDFIFDFQLKLNLPYDLQSLCEGSNEAGIFKMLQEIDRICVETVKMGQSLQRVAFSNQASIIRDECRTYVCKIIRKIVKESENTAQHVEKIQIKIELLNIKNLSFKNITAPPLHYFREEIHLLPVGLQFLHAFLPNPLKYLHNH